MDQLLRYGAVLAMIFFGAFELFFGLLYGDWSIQALIGIGAALGLFILTLQPPQGNHRGEMKN
ncbi:hypothetical protein [Jeotgalibacillus campisalis]|uniref:Uncharacterized protein n=1 Tax=Jeotgalibacillus campisalis TaxID=220754 RepID=A0A0C2S3Y3_9BACL|nr:hypothetical protein [Jeotgalibacillus campisalis]KIL48699.1 hypothetical protein KR50_12840 [Jeotgalibacillus campisalis]